MKKIIAFVLFSVLLLGAVTPCIGATQQDDVTASQDSTLSVIGWFCKCDTAVYWIQEGEWSINNGDTIKTAGVSTKVMVTVTDSTATGYKMDYTFLDVRCDTLDNSELNERQNKIALIGKKLIGTTISFETDEYGDIVKFNNIDKLKAQAKTLSKDAVNEIAKLPSMKELKKKGADVKGLTQGMADGDVLVAGYLEDINMLFMCHGNVYNLGDTITKKEATERQFESETYTNVSIDDDEFYSIMSESVTIIPKSDVKELCSEVMDLIKYNEVKDNFDSIFDSSVDDDCTNNSYIDFSFLPNGWPYEILKQDVTMIGDRGKAKQKTIRLDSYTFGD